MEGLRAECHGIICLLEASLWLLCAVWTGGGEGIASWFLLPLADREEAHHTERVWERCPSLWGVSLQEGFPIIAPSPPESPPFLAKPTASKETLRGFPGWYRRVPQRCPAYAILASYLSARQHFPGYPWDIHSPCGMRGERVENLLPGRSGPAQSDQPGGSAASPFWTHPCGARASPAGMQPGQPSLPCPRLPGKHPPRYFRPSQQ